MNATSLIGVILAIGVGFYVMVAQSNMSRDIGAVVARNMQAQTVEPEAPRERAAEEGPEPDPFDKNIVNEGGRSVSRQAVSYLLDPARFDRKRTVTVEVPVSPASLLRPGEAMPEGDLRRLMVEARSAALADAACERLLGSLAGRCGVSGFGVEGGVGGRDRMNPARAAMFADIYVVSTTMVFVPKAPVGSYPETATVMLNNREFDLDPWIMPGPWAAAYEPKLAELYEAAEAACADIRGVYGNCMLRSARMALSGREPGEVRRSFTLAWFSPVYGDTGTTAETGADPADMPVGAVE
ncbi:hypothetical protein [Sinisalibacter aestuarii]|uniref:Uncharacterized protein n=1 Tax=Sinisalibacter aestuarii TaxID=2949426 RepID=A0ABQ5LWS5_9RHOB|nr:hypothetical protein [Sinisalibacter aestuarii]GKY89073.1 hypothetical protein STA1M1_29420 [Sinisalibacter aestuarii]